MSDEEAIEKKKKQIQEEVIERQEEFESIVLSIASTIQLLINDGHDKSIVFAAMLEFTAITLGCSLISPDAVIPLNKKFVDLLLHGMAIRQHTLNEEEK